MSRLVPRSYWLLWLVLLSPAAGYAAPTPYWPGYPPPFYYPPGAASGRFAPSSTVQPTTQPTIDQLDAAAAPATGTDAAAQETVPATSPHEKPQRSTAEALAVKPVAEGSKDPQPLSKAEPVEDSTFTEEIASAIQQGNFAEAYYLWRPLAEGGDADAQYGIGWMYHNGYGLAIDDEEAIAWWELASHQGHVDATFALGMLYSLGEGELRRDMAKAVSYYHKAAIAGHEDAQLLLRTLMAEGNPEARKLMHTLLATNRIAEITPPASITSNKANLRKSPSTQSKVIATLQQGATLMPLRREGRWLLVGIKGREYTGWIYDSLVGRDVLLEH